MAFGAPMELTGVTESTRHERHRRFLVSHDPSDMEGQTIPTPLNHTIRSVEQPSRATERWSLFAAGQAWQVRTPVRCRGRATGAFGR